MTPLECAARAMRQGMLDRLSLSDLFPSWDLTRASERTEWLATANDCLTAIRKPSAAMIDAGVAGIDAVEGDCATRDGVEAGYIAMIDSALIAALEGNSL